MTYSNPTPMQPGARLLDGSDVNKSLAQPQYSAEDTITALGTTVADAFQLRAAVSWLSTVAAATGVKLPLRLGPGAEVVVYNDGANPVQVYDAEGNTIDGVAGATGVPLANAKRCIFTKKPSGAWASAQLGVVSA